MSNKSLFGVCALLSLLSIEVFAGKCPYSSPGVHSLSLEEKTSFVATMTNVIRKNLRNTKENGLIVLDGKRTKFIDLESKTSSSDLEDIIQVVDRIQFTSEKQNKCEYLLMTSEPLDGGEMFLTVQVSG